MLSHLQPKESIQETLEKIFQEWDRLKVSNRNLRVQEALKSREQSMLVTRWDDMFYRALGLVGHLQELQSEQELR